MTEFHGSVFEVDFSTGVIEAVMGHHFETGEVALGNSNFGNVSESETGLRDHEGVCGGLNSPGGHPGLKIVDRRLYEEHVVPPPRNHRVASDPGMSALFEVVKVELSKLIRGITFLDRTVSGEGIRSARGLRTELAGSLGPERAPATPAGLPHEPFLPKEFVLVLLFIHSWEGTDNRSTQSFYGFGSLSNLRGVVHENLRQDVFQQ